MRSTGWQHAVDRSFPSHDAIAPAARRDEAMLQNIALRDDLLREYVGSADDGLRPATPGVFEGAGSSSEHRFDEFRSTIAGERRPIDTAVAHVSAWLRAKGVRSPAFRARLKQSLAEFGKPASARDFASTVLSDELSSAIDVAFPDPSDPSLLRAELAKPAHKAGEEAVERMARMKLVDMLNGIDRGDGIQRVLANVERPASASGLLREREAQDLAVMLDGIAQDRSQDSHECCRPPASAATDRVVDRTRTSRARSPRRWYPATRPTPISSTRAADCSGTLGGYDDMFSAGERGHEETALASALPLHSPPGAANDNLVSGGGSPDLSNPGSGGAVSGGEEVANAGEQAFAMEGEAARSFAMLEGSVRVGGVLIGEKAWASRPTSDRLFGSARAPCSVSQ